MDKQEFLKELNVVVELEDEAESRKRKLLRKCGWVESSVFPDARWRWCKVMRGGRVTLSLNDALRVEDEIIGGV